MLVYVEIIEFLKVSILQEIQRHVYAMLIIYKMTLLKMMKMMMDLKKLQ